VPVGIPAAAASTLTPVEALTVLESLPDGDHLLMVWAPGVRGGMHSMRVARALSLRTDVALVEVSGTATQAAAAGAVAAASVVVLPAVAAPLLVAEVNRTSRRVAITSSVTRLQDPQPSLVQHAASLLPWTSFTVDVDRGEVVTGGRPPRRAHGLSGPAFAAVSDDAARSMLDTLQGWIGRPPIVVPAPARAAGEARRWVEVTVMPAEPLTLVQRWAQSVQLTTCLGCGRTAASPQCLFCGRAASSGSLSWPRFRRRSRTWRVRSTPVVCSSPAPRRSPGSSSTC
jgi:hypothetical protein